MSTWVFFPAAYLLRAPSSQPRVLHSARALLLLLNLLHQIFIDMVSRECGKKLNIIGFEISAQERR